MPIAQELLDEIASSGRDKITRALVRVNGIIRNASYSESQQAQAREYKDALEDRLAEIGAEESAVESD